VNLIAFGQKIIQTSSLDEMQVFFSDGHISAKNNVDVQLFDFLLDAHAFFAFMTFSVAHILLRPWPSTFSLSLRPL